MRYIIGFLMVVLLAGTASAQEGEPGYVDFSKLDIPFQKDSSVEILLRRPLLRLISESSREEDPEFADLLTRLRLIHVQSFSFPSDDAEYINERVSRAAAQFDREKDWESVVRIKGRTESSFISLKMRRDQVVGLLMMVVESKREVFYINIVGDIDMGQVGRIGRKFKIIQLENIRMPK